MEIKLSQLDELREMLQDAGVEVRVCLRSGDNIIIQVRNPYKVMVELYGEGQDYDNEPKGKTVKRAS